jgi:peptide/nickel transport system substrate-binding protein
MTPRSSLTILLTVAALLVGWSHGLSAQPQPTGEVVIAWPVTIVPVWFDPAETPAQITPFAFLYALHDGLVRPLPGERMGNSLAASWTESPDGLTYEFTLRPHLQFHNGDPCTAEDVQFSFERYRGSGATELHAKVKSVEVVDPLTVRFHLHAPWPDFMTFYGTTATAAGLVVPKKYLQQVGEDGFKKHPIGLGPYKFISHVPGVELVLEAYEGYWRHPPHVKRLIMQGVPEDATRLAMLKKGEADIAIAFLDGAVAEEVQRDPQLTLVATRHASIQWLESADPMHPFPSYEDIRLKAP